MPTASPQSSPLSPTTATPQCLIAQLVSDPAASAHANQTWVLTGDWRQSHGQSVPALPSLPAPPQAPAPASAIAQTTTIALDGRQLSHWDSALASQLWQLQRDAGARGLRIDTSALPEGLREVLRLADYPIAPGNLATGRPFAPLTHLGHAVMQRLRVTIGELTVTLGFVGEVILALLRVMTGRSALRWRDLAWQIEQAGPRSLPIVSLVSFLVGLILAYMGAEQLYRFGAQVFIADLMTIGETREIAALMTGIILSGRLGAAYAAQLGSMMANEEIDALRTLGLDPFDVLVLPRMLALLLMAPLLTAYAAVVGMLAGWAVAVSIYGVAPMEYLIQSRDAITLPHLLIGLFKGTVYCVLIALAGCRQGLYSGRSAQAVGEATTAAVVQSIVWIVVAASALTIMFQQLGW